METSSPPSPGRNAQTARCTDAYETWGVSYVLLGGDVSIVPFRGAYASTSGQTDTAMPCDLYFACLDGTWNADNDALWGEPTDGEDGGDVDLLAEVYVGRAPVDTPAEATAFVAKTIAYADNRHANVDDALLLGEYLGLYNGIVAQGGDGLDPLLPSLSRHYVSWLDDRPQARRTWNATAAVAALGAAPHPSGTMATATPSRAWAWAAPTSPASSTRIRSWPAAPPARAASSTNRIASPRN